MSNALVPFVSVTNEVETVADPLNTVVSFVPTLFVNVEFK